MAVCYTFRNNVLRLCSILFDLSEIYLIFLQALLKTCKRNPNGRINESMIQHTLSNYPIPFVYPLLLVAEYMRRDLILFGPHF